MSNKAVAIIGNGRSRIYAPHGRPGVDIWTMNDHAMLWGRHTDAVFEMHPDALEARRYSDEYKTWLQQPQTFPIYMHETDERIPSSRRYPRQEIAEWFPRIYKGDRRVQHFYTTTTPYCLALAIHLNYERIILCGIDLERDVHQEMKDAIFYFMGMAGARGITLEIAEGSALMDDAIYPDIMPKRRRRK